MSLEARVTEYLRANPGKKAREIADALGEDKSTVNSCLYRLRGSAVEQVPGFRWRVLSERGNEPRNRVDDRTVSSSPLAKLCRYYLACLAKDLDRNVSEFAASKYGTPDYAELPHLPFDGHNEAIWNSEAARRVFAKIRRERRKLSLVFGYPTRLAFVRAKSGWEGFFVEPLLVFEFDIEQGGNPSLSDERPEINIRALRALSGQSGPELLDEVILLQQELGIDSESFSLDDFEDMFAALPQVRPEWPWKEALEPTALAGGPTLAEIREDGIYNRAILLAAERSPYTQGLETELRELEKLSTAQYQSTALGYWLGADRQAAVDDQGQPLIEVLPLNSEQRSAVRSCLSSPLTVITGPPGTGKSQVVTSIVANCAWRGQRVLFASKNHKAVDVVETRVNAMGPRPVLLRLGTNEIQAKLAEYLASLLAATTLDHERQEYDECQERYRGIVAERASFIEQLDGLVALRNDTDRLEQEVEQLREHFPGGLWARVGRFDPSELKRRLQGARPVVRSALRAEQGLFTRLFWSMVWRERVAAAVSACRALETAAGQIGHPPFPDLGQQKDATALSGHLDVLGRRLEASERIGLYFRSLDRLTESPGSEDLTRSLLSNEQALSEISASLWDLWLRLQPSRLTRAERQLLGDYKALLETITQGRDSNERVSGQVYRRFYELFPKLTNVLPAWAVTNLSARGRIPLEAGFFDLLIVDEASQCDIASVLPLLYRCKRAAIIGDPKQLRHITQIASRVTQQLMQEHDVSSLGERWSYTGNSLFDLSASLTESGDVISLRDHHRSRSEIIEFSNRHFYEGRLRVATRESELRVPNGAPAVRWIHVTGGVVRPASGGAVNREEARTVVRELERLLAEQRYEGTVGVVSPFRAQANLIRDLVNQNDRLLGAIGGSDLLIETVYRFQGDERDVMVFSPVVSRDMPRTAEGFLRGNPNTFNVAITRARAALVVVGDHRACSSCSVEHLAAFARYVEESERTRSEAIPERGNFGPEYPAVAHPERVSDWERYLYAELYKAGIRCIPQYSVEKYDLDLAVVIGDRRLDIEVDGERYHRSWNGELALRDQIRNRRLIELGWDVMRFWVYQVRDDLPRCIKRVQRWVEAVAATTPTAAREEDGWRVDLVETSAESGIED